MDYPLFIEHNPCKKCFVCCILRYDYLLLKIFNTIICSNIFDSRLSFSYILVSAISIFSMIDTSRVIS